MAEFGANLLLRLGFIMCLAAVVPAVHLFDVVTCEHAEAVIVAPPVGGKASIAFRTADGSAVRTTVKLATLQRHFARPGDRIEIAYRRSHPETIAPLRRMQDTLLGLTVAIAGAVMLVLRRLVLVADASGHAAPRQPAPAERAPIQRRRSGDRAMPGTLATAGTRHVSAHGGVVQRTDSSWTRRFG